MTFTFSEAPVGFTAADISAAGGTVSGLTATADPLVYTATFTASDSFSGTGSVSVAAGSYTDAAGNTGAGGSDTVTIDRLNPTVAVNIVDASLNDGDSSSQVTFTFSEAPVGFTAADITAAGGTVTGLTATADPLVYTATFTATDEFAGTGSVTVGTAATRYGRQRRRGRLGQNRDDRPGRGTDGSPGQQFRGRGVEQRQIGQYRDRLRPLGQHG